MSMGCVGRVSDEVSSTFQGVPGLDGMKGAQGEPGTKGERGDPGLPGTDGIPGAEVQLAFDYRSSSGATATQSDTV
ncbi:hypothetical protein HN011_001377 [Eciton burchellii]|nr:hypothetical protein HN011_001377 [Eciton burchellii]